MKFRGRGGYSTHGRRAAGTAPTGAAARPIKLASWWFEGGLKTHPRIKQKKVYETKLFYKLYLKTGVLGKKCVPTPAIFELKKKARGPEAVTGLAGAVPTRPVVLCPGARGF